MKCKCQEKPHRKGCGCITDAFVDGARRKLFSALDNAGKDPEALKERIKMLTHHVCDEHEWDGGQCDFHKLIVCSCGECKGDGITCAGKRYKTRLLLDCPYHNLAYFVELHNRSKLAEKVIDKELGRGHTNQLESANSALIRFRKKCWNIQRVHYITSSNLGLLESNLTFMQNNRGTQYHWLPALYERLGVPDFDGVRAYYKEKNRKREAQCLERQTTENKKQAFIANEKHWHTEQEKRRDYTKKDKQIHHTYGGPDDEPEIRRSVKQCECGGTDHVRKTHHKCSLNPLNAQSTSRQALISQSAQCNEDDVQSESEDSDAHYDEPKISKKCVSCGGTNHL